MKTYLAILLLGVLLGMALADDNKEKMKKISEECMKENKVDAQQAKDLWTGKIPFTEAPANAKCSMRCVMVKAGFMDPKTSKFQPEGVRAQHKGKNEAKLEEAIKECGSLDNANPCEKAFQITACMMKNFDHK